MGRHTDSDSDSYRSSRKSKKKRRSRSRSHSSDSTYSSHSRHKKKKSKRSRRGSRSPKRRRSRSRSRDRRRRSRSRSRSRSYERRRRSRSRSRSRRRSSSNSRSSLRNDTTRNNFKVETDPSSVPGFDLMTPLEQNEVKMQLALRAAEMATERLKAAGMLEEGAGQGAGQGASSSLYSATAGLSASEIEKRRKAIEDIESDDFKQRQFKSGSGQKQSLSARKELELSHDSAIFGDLLAGTGSSGALSSQTKELVIKDDQQLLAPIFFEDESQKMARWMEKLSELRRTTSYSNGAVS